MPLLWDLKQVFLSLKRDFDENEVRRLKLCQGGQSLRFKFWIGPCITSNVSYVIRLLFQVTSKATHYFLIYKNVSELLLQIRNTSFIGDAL